MSGFDPRQIAHQRAERAHPSLIGLSHWIHANPELQFAEHMASGWVAEALEKAAFEVERAAGGLPTAVAGHYGPGPLHVALLAEYDALPEVGHACGHNVIAATAVGAGMALAGVAEQLGLRVSVIGTPAEEGGAGKQVLLDAGVFEGVHMALMTHPGPSDTVAPDVLAVQTMDVGYHGRTAHAAAFPELGINAADALVVAQVALSLLRQSLTASQRIHGIVVRGGEAANLIPAETQASFMVRAATLEELDELLARVRSCFEAGAVASGARLELHMQTAYAEMRHDLELAELYRRNAEQLGRSFAGDGRLEFARFSTDAGNVSRVMPTIHPIIGIDSAPAVNHQPEFAAAATSPAADQAILDGAVALAWTAIDAAQDTGLRERLLRRG
ncbi:MAG: M20 family metallopeptidase, partial [Chloroflexota bacterium]|nr:M20 family metallopeptidase [Chloroflexota bacterium]